ncbi:heavy metal-binding domain-containing protein [Flavobacterium sp. ZT3R17]|uniref:heavy metal-binding domain-containing protein n=1 Tax=Flavobacterium cryoconiti TaxID=3398736 RepID=UPI003A8845AF
MKNLLLILLAFAFTSIGFAQDTVSKKGDMHEMMDGKMMDGKMHDSMHTRMHEKMYTCPMHSDVMQDHPGKCPKCGMNLVESKNRTKGYCPMCKEKTMMKDGKCTKCGKQITKYGEKGQSKKVYICSSCHAKSKTSGKCPKCGAKMEEMK